MKHVSIYRDYRELIQATETLDKNNVDYEVERIYLYEEDIYLYAVIRNS